MSLIAGTVLLSGCDSALLDPKGQIGLEQRSLILTAFGLMMIVVIPAVLMAVGFAWKYRASNKDAKYSPNWSHSNKVEAVVWTVPILIILFLAVLTWKTTHALEPSKPLAHDEKPITIEFLQAIYYAGIDIQYMLTGYPSKHTYDDELEKLETMSKLAKSL